MRQAYCIIVFGLRGSGKTTLVRSIVGRLEAPVLILDSQDDFSIGSVYGSADELLSGIEKGAWSGVHVLKTRSDLDSRKFFKIARHSARYYQNGITIVVDEVDKWGGLHRINEDLDWIIRYGRSDLIRCVFAARRPAEVSTAIRSQADAFVSLKQRGSADVRAIAERAGDKEAEVVRSLGIYAQTGEPSEYIVVGELPGSLTFLKKGAKLTV